ncbi:hypothetical protein DIE18_04035 [Burkholderia sp. Bp9125]|nr:hypothetical protein DIE18_04035 [Burkholderia sp. Bp9125]
MNLPTVEFLKGQADRLITYLGDKHRFRMKPASALEALAALYQQPDWNTLQARAAASCRPQPTPAREEHESYPLDWGQYGGEFAVPRADWQRHVLALGGDGDARRDWLQRHLSAQIERGGAGVFVNLFGGELPAAAREQLEAHAQVLDLASSRGLACNVFTGLPAMDAADVLVSALRERLSDDYWRTRMHGVMSTLFLVMEAIGAHVTLNRVCGELRRLGADGGASLVNACPSGIPARAVAQSLLDSLRGESNEGGAVRMLCVRMAESMEAWLRMPGLSRLFAEQVNAPGLLALMSGPQCLVVEMADQDSWRLLHVQGALLLGVAHHAVCTSLQLPREPRDTHPRLLALAEVQGYLSMSLRPAVERGRSAGWTMLLTVPDEHYLRRSMAGDTGASFLANVWNRMYLDGLPESALGNAFDRLSRARQVVVSPGHLRYRD